MIGLAIANHYLWNKNAEALRHKMMAEFLENVRDWPEDAKRSLLEAIERMLKKPKTKKKFGPLDAFGSWVGPETAEEIMDMIYSARPSRPNPLSCT